ncbi:MAG: DM13 domain-containing protein [Gemmatimonadales bacterium]
MSRKVLLLAAALIVALAGWYYFRPERAFLDSRVSEAAPGETATVLLRGEFTPRAHDGRGRAEVLQLADGRRILRFTEFEILNGPDLQVYLLGSADAAGGRDLDAHGFLSLGALKGNAGDQNYAIPADADLSKYRAVSVWCRRFGVNFTAAPLGPPTPPTT